MSVTDLGIDGLEDIEQIGTGGSSRVYRARQTDLDRVVAVKVLNAGEDQDVVRRFDRERKAMGRLSLHEGIVPVYSSGLTAHGEPYLVMPYYPSGSLQDQIDTGAMDWETAVHYVDVAAETIAAAHDEGIVHLDLKPANILLTVNGAPRIADFGIARLLTGSTAARTNGNAAFTPAYSAPETFLDGETGPASDVYGLGATLWALLVGHPPFLTPGNDTNLMSVIGRVVNNPVGDLRHFTPGPLCDVIERAMSKQPATRYQTAREFSQALKAASATIDGPATTAMAAPLAAPVADSTAADASPPGSVLFPNADLSYEDAGMTNVLPAGPELPASLASTVAPSDPPQRPLLQETAQPLPAPVGSRPLPPQRAPYLDFERFRLGPVILGAIAFLIVGIAALLVLNGGDDETATTAITNPAAPSTDTSVDSSLSSTTVSSTVSSSVTEAPTTATTAAAAPGTSATTTATTAATTETTTNTSATTETTASTTETTLETTTSSTTESSTTETTAGSTTSTSSTTLAIPIEPPTGLSATPAADEVSLIWVAPASGPAPSGYIVSRDGAAIATVTATGYTDTNVVAGEEYTYTVQSVGADAADTSDPSGAQSVTIPPASTTSTPTTAPALSVNASATGFRTRINISITSDQCISYRVTATPEGGAALPARTGPLAEPCGTSHDVIITGLEPGTSYTIEVVGSTDAASDSVTLTESTNGN